MFLTALWAIHTSFLENINLTTTVCDLPTIRMKLFVTTVFQNILFGKNWPEKLKQRIQGWPTPWFLLVNLQEKSVTFAPSPPPYNFVDPIPLPTDHPPDNFDNFSNLF